VVAVGRLCGRVRCGRGQEGATAALDERFTLTRRLLDRGANGAELPRPSPFPATLHAFGTAGFPVLGLADG
jgi:hypothetical protein